MKSRGLRLQLTAAIDRSAVDSGFALNASQVAVRDRLLDVGEDLLAPRRRRPRGGSLYVWGEAGRGKSWLLDAYFEALPIEAKRRVHFHGFFDQLHRKIHERRGAAGAVEEAVRDLTAGAKVLYFDEFHVHDSGDAALLTRLLRRLFAEDVVLLASSNYAPSSLLPNPVWHHLIEQGIELILDNMDVMELEGSVDYRGMDKGSTTGFRAGHWIAPATDVQLKSAGLHRPQPDEAAALTVGSRNFPITAQRGRELWITFDQLCCAPTSSVEYLQWVQRFDHWVVLNVPTFDTAGPEAQQRLINVIDILCDSDVQTTIVSSASAGEFREGARNRPDAFRMLSRLQLLRNMPAAVAV